MKEKKDEKKKKNRIQSKFLSPKTLKIWQQVNKNTVRPVRLSKSLSWLLRHGAQKEGITMDKNGYVDVDVILRHRNFKGITLEELQDLVETNDKQRFTIRHEESTNKWQIKANQGHTLQIEDLELKPISASEAVSKYPNVIHGTNPKAWENIKSSRGLSRMRRNHIHLCSGEPSEERVISGMRASANVWIYIDVQSAIQDGFQFFISPNNVILTPGDHNGFLPMQYFKKVTHKKRDGADTIIHQRLPSC